MAYKDAGHRPHASFKGELPQTKFSHGPNDITVTLDTWGPKENLFTTLYDELQSNWGNEPERSDSQPLRREYTRYYDGWLPAERVTAYDERRMNIDTGWARLTDEQREYVERAFKGETLQNPLEGLAFKFTIDGVARAFTHQIVRSRIGAAFMQHGGRDNDWRHRGWTMPETIWRACDPGYSAQQGLETCVTEPQEIEKYLGLTQVLHALDYKPSLYEAIEAHLKEGKLLYAALVDAGIPWQDARRVLPMGTQTYIHATYNYLALRDVLANRLEHIMDWEINCVAQLMLREVRMWCPPVMWKHLGSHSDKVGIAKFAGLESWPPDGKWPAPTEEQCECGHHKANHTVVLAGCDHELCDLCKCTSYREVVTPRTHTHQQMPFWVLSKESMNGGPIHWIPTNGEFPQEEKL